MSGKETAGAEGPPEDVIDVDLPLAVPYVPEYMQRVVKLVDIFKLNFPCIYVNNDTKPKIHNVHHEGQALKDPYATIAALRVYNCKPCDNLHRQMCVLYDIAKVYEQRELGDKFAGARKDVSALLKLLHASTPVQRQ